jgi:uncharacterized membrane protein|tara:strand:+ start:1693 stop:3042 length:1350 start_codon:yes stop_codon:yes gene_type:complete
MRDLGASVTDWLSQLRSSYGFLPAVMATVTVLIAIAALSAPPGWGAALAEAVGLPPAPGVDAMRDLMSLIASATIGTGAVAFSVIVAASVTAAGQYGPRLLTNFLADRATQVTLGVFVSSFVYALIVYAAIRDETPGYGIAGIVAMVFALASVAALIYFLHHAPSALRINQAVSKIGRSLLKNAGTRFPGTCGHAVCPEDLDAAAARYQARGPSFPLFAAEAGIVSIIDGEKLSLIAERADALVVLRTRPGDFLVPGQPIADVHAMAVPEGDCLNELRSAFAVAKLRTPSQDIEFLADELTEIAMRALSSGINDPYTAIACMQWLGAALAEIARTPDPIPYRRSEEGGFRVYVEPLGFASYLEGTMGRIRQVSATNVRAAEGHLAALAHAAVGAVDNERAMGALEAEARALLAQARIALDGPDLKAVEACGARFDTVVSESPPALDKFR